MSELTRQRGAHPVQLDRERIIFFDASATWLLVEKYGAAFLPELYLVDRDGATTTLKLRSVPVLQFFLFAGLQADARLAGENLTFEDCEQYIRPWTMLPLFNALVKALSGAVFSPPETGKASAAPVGAKAAPKRRPLPVVSTLRRRSGTPSGF
jgi:hypothetical protein